MGIFKLKIVTKLNLWELDVSQDVLQTTDIKQSQVFYKKGLKIRMNESKNSTYCRLFEHVNHY
jgi:hypothetical protein